jgi:hypothetical protein
MAKQPAEQIAGANADAPTKSGEAAERIMKGNTEALTESGNASRAAVREAFAEGPRTHVDPVSDAIPSDG